jgi:rRNA biogenesis protein RRP5
LSSDFSFDFTQNLFVDIALITKFAQMEFKFGSPERGRTIFETLLATYPKRVDLWNVYLDLEISQKNVDKVRALFERVTDSNFSSKKMKFLFKKWLQFEKNFGNPNTETHVKNKASTYVEKKLKGN